MASSATKCKHGDKTWQADYEELPNTGTELQHLDFVDDPWNIHNLPGNPTSHSMFHLPKP